MSLPNQNDTRQQVLRAALEARRRELTHDLRVRTARIREQVGDIAQLIDDADSCDLDAALVDLGTRTIHRIDEAIERLEAGDYGVCARCGDGIGEARLRALPFAALCCDCEAERERDGAPNHPDRRRAWLRGLVSGDIQGREDP